MGLLRLKYKASFIGLDLILVMHEEENLVIVAWYMYAQINKQQPKRHVSLSVE